MSLKKEKEHAAQELARQQNKITRFARMGVEVGESKELYEAIKMAKFWRRELNAMSLL